MNKEKFKPCPFCGGEAELEYFEDSFGENKVHIFCKNWECVASTKPFDREQPAISAWNKRVKIRLADVMR